MLGSGGLGVWLRRYSWVWTTRVKTFSKRLKDGFARSDARTRPLSKVWQPLVSHQRLADGALAYAKVMTVVVPKSAGQLVVPGAGLATDTCEAAAANLVAASGSSSSREARSRVRLGAGPNGPR